MNTQISSQIKVCIQNRNKGSTGRQHKMNLSWIDSEKLLELPEYIANSMTSMTNHEHYGYKSPSIYFLQKCQQKVFFISW